MSYKTVKNQSSFTFTEKKSEFIGYCAPVRTEAEAVAFVNSIKKKHSDARHNVYAYVLQEGFAQRFSDDGEPHGTAGMPVLDSIRKAGVTDVAVVVTRYFGGILLGTGGLVRAYTAAAVGALKEAGIAEVGEFSLIRLKANYSDYQKLMPLISATNARIEESDFATDVFLTVMVRQEQAQSFMADITESTNGRVASEIVGTKTDFI
ncbi:MAG: YigZ family protein [Clostridia bacterium]|nr:YigZ family protein [Clostridia bacterium]MBR5277827.1 YigZ family protein [Clostridia bacterium]